MFPGVIKSRLSGNEGHLVDKCLVMITKLRLGKASEVFSFRKQKIQLRLVVCVMYGGNCPSGMWPRSLRHEPNSPGCNSTEDAGAAPGA